MAMIGCMQQTPHNIRSLALSMSFLNGHLGLSKAPKHVRMWHFCECELVSHFFWFVEWVVWLLGSWRVYLFFCIGCVQRRQRLNNACIFFICSFVVPSQSLPQSTKPPVFDFNLKSVTVNVRGSPRFAQRHSRRSQSVYFPYVYSCPSRLFHKVSPWRPAVRLHRQCFAKRWCSF